MEITYSTSKINLHVLPALLVIAQFSTHKNFCNLPQNRPSFFLPLFSTVVPSTVENKGKLILT